MAFLGVDIGGTKLSLALFTAEGEVLSAKKLLLEGRTGTEAGRFITGKINEYRNEGHAIEAIGICVPGISRSKTGTVWAPNIPGWDDYPLLQEVEQVAGGVPVAIDSDRACSILGEQWQGNAKGVKDAVFLAVGTGIGAGILVNGMVLRGAHDIAGAIGWLALGSPFEAKYISCGFFEYHASGEGIARVAKDLLEEAPEYTGVLRRLSSDQLTAADVFNALGQNDKIAVQVLQLCIRYWGMAAANLVSLFNPEKILFGGGVFGPACSLIPAILEEAQKWAQPISITQVSFEPTALGDRAGVYGAGFLALNAAAPHTVNAHYV